MVLYWVYKDSKLGARTRGPWEASGPTPTRGEAVG